MKRLMAVIVALVVVAIAVGEANARGGAAQRAEQQRQQGVAAQQMSSVMTPDIMIAVNAVAKERKWEAVSPWSASSWGLIRYFDCPENFVDNCTLLLTWDGEIRANSNRIGYWWNFETHQAETIIKK